MLENVAFLSVLLASTLVVTLLYGRRIHEVKKKYVEAKSVVGDIVASFNRQLQKQKAGFETSSRKIDAVATRSDLVALKLEQQNKVVQTLVEKMGALSKWEKRVAKINDLETKIGEVASIEDSLLKKLADIEHRGSLRKSGEVKIDSAIPIKTEKALAPLTETELVVLELLAVEGEKTAPETKHRIKLSREHTARLMKKLYEEGYLERKADKIPFTYRLKEEMLRILKNPQQES